MTRSAQRRSTGGRKMDLRSLSRGRLGYSGSSCRSLACRSSTAMLGLFRSIFGLPSTQAQRLSDEHQSRSLSKQERAVVTENLHSEGSCDCRLHE